MGLKLRVNVFYQVEARDVYDVYKTFYAARGQDFLESGVDQLQYVLYERDQDWTVLSWEMGWEWSVRRQAQLEVSRRLACKGFLLFVYDGDYWGYEYFNSGESLDQFVQEEQPCGGIDWFPGQSCAGNPELIAGEFPHLGKDNVAAYLVRDPLWMKTLGEIGDEEWNARRAEFNRLDVPVRPGDEFTRFDECAVVDFLRFLGVRVELRDGYVTFIAPKSRTFWVSSDGSFDRLLARLRKLTAENREICVEELFSDPGSSDRSPN